MDAANASTGVIYWMLNNVRPGRKRWCGCDPDQINSRSILRFAPFETESAMAAGKPGGRARVCHFQQC